MDFNIYKTIPEWHFIREIPHGMSYLVKEGDDLSADMILAKGYISTSIYNINLDHFKNPREILKVVDGQLVSKGDIILKDKSVSPIEGIVDLSKIDDKKLVIKSVPEYLEIKSFVIGKVLSTENDNITIASKVLRFFVPVLIGNKIQGILRCVNDETDLNVSFKDTILVSDLLTNTLLYKAKAMGVKGIIGKSMDIECLNSKIDTHFSMASVLGFGKFDTIVEFTKWDNHFSEIDPQSFSFIIAANE